MMHLIIRADASAAIGSGHVMRCLALAQACRAQGGTAVFLSHCESEALRKRILDSGFGFIPVAESHPASADLQTTLSLLAQPVPSCLVLDGYHFDLAYQQAVRAAGYRLLVIDDTGHLPHYHADVLLNHSLSATRLPYHCDADTFPLLGPCYALLRPEFLAGRGWRRETPDVARRILVTLGGSDPDNVTLTVIQALQQLDMTGLEARIIVGLANPHLEMLQRAVQPCRSRLQLLSGVTDMATLMSWAEVAIAAGGGTCWELAFMGVPALVLVLADNQAGVAKGLAECGAGIDLGQAVQLHPAQIAGAVSALMHDRARRQRMSILGRVLVDGKGAERVMTALSASGEAGDNAVMRLRPATLDDAGLLWQWANDPVARANSFHAEAIGWEEHLTWYTTRRAAAGTRLWLLECRHMPLGQIRYDRIAPDTAQISYLVAPGCRGKGIGTQLLARSSAVACRELGVHRLQGITFAANAASARAFLKAGYRQVEEKCIDGRACLIFAWPCV